MVLPRPCAAAAAALLLLAAALPAALGSACSAQLNAAISTCHDKVQAAMASAAGLIDAAAIKGDTACCAAASKIFEAGFTNACGCDPAVLKILAGAQPAAIATMRALTADRCAAQTTDFPTNCPASVVRPSDTTPNPPPGGTGSVCKSTDKCKTLCPSKYPDAAKFQAAKDKFVTKCNTKKNNGYCKEGPFPQPEIYTEGNGTSVCALPEGTVDVTRNKTVGSETCIACCKPIGDIRKRVRGDINTYKQPIQIAANKNLCSNAAMAGCFPGAARVTLADGSSKALSELAVGDKVLTVTPEGGRAFEDVVFFDHELPSGRYQFVRLNLAGGAALELTGGHFVPVGDKLAAAVMTRARDVKAGDAVFVMPEGAAAAEPALVDSVEAVTREGMFAPVTTGGAVVVDGVVASSYSDWILDPVFDFLGMPEKLPAAMHAVHAPLRWGYAALGPKVLRALSPIISGIAQLDARQIAAGLGMQASA